MTKPKQTSKAKPKLVPHIVGSRFFTVPEFGATADDLRLKARLIEPEEPQKPRRDRKMMRYAAYVRVSSEEQVGNFSIDAQRRAIESWVKGQDGKLVKTYSDEGESGRSANRPAFQKMRRDARKNKFDAIVVHKFDRFSRSRTDALAIKTLLRQDYNIKVFSASEPSEDSDGPIGALIEGIMECVADWYSRNLATETAKGKLERARQGYHNNRPPFGFDKAKKGVLTPNETEAEALRLAFELYATGEYSDNAIARKLSDEGYRSKTGRRFSTDTVRDMLQNRTYLGYVKYQKYRRRADGTRSYDAPVRWFKGKHDAIIDPDLFERCQEIREAKAIHHDYYPKKRTYLLRDLIYCAECVKNMPENINDDSYGKMRPFPNSDGTYRYYRCRAGDFGRTCPQRSVRCDLVEAQVVNLLKNLKPPEDWRERMVEALGELLGEKKLDERIDEIKEVIERMDFRWDHGFIADQDAYLEERIKLQQELEKLSPIPDDDLDVAADLLENFGEHWEETGGDRKEQMRLMQLIVSRVWVRDKDVVAMSLRPNYHIALGLQSNKPTEISVSSEKIMSRRERREWFDSLYSLDIHPPSWRSGISAWWFHCIGH